jgi:hypothetical protein
MSTPPNTEGTVIAEGQYSYMVDDRPKGSEMWRITRLEDGRILVQALLGAGQHILYGMDMMTNTEGGIEALTIQIPDADGGAVTRRAALHFTPGAVRGQIEGAEGRAPIDLGIPPNTLPYPASIATRFLIGRSVNLTIEQDQPLSLCVISIPESQPSPPIIVKASATVLGPEPVDLLMATIDATHVLIEWPGHPPQHVWLDERRFPIRWYWVDSDTDTAQDFSLSRYIWSE